MRIERVILPSLAVAVAAIGICHASPVRAESCPYDRAVYKSEDGSKEFFAKRGGDTRDGKHFVLVGTLDGEDVAVVTWFGGPETTGSVKSMRAFVEAADWTKDDGQFLDNWQGHDGPAEGIWYFDRCR